MDPNATLSAIRQTLADLKTAGDRDQEVQLWGDLEDRVEALDEWLTKGGFLPDAWDDQARVTGYYRPASTSNEFPRMNPDDALRNTCGRKFGH